MKKILFWLCLGCQFQAYAQEDDVKKVYGFYFSIPSKVLLIDELNNQLRASNQLPLSPAILGASLGYTLRSSNKNTYSSVRLSYLLGGDDDYEEELKATRFGLWQLSFDAHYDVIKNPDWLFYPYFNVGTNWATLNVSQINADFTFQQSLGNLSYAEVNEKKYRASFLLFAELGVGVERKIGISGQDCFVGLSGGYSFSQSEAWTFASIQQYADAPAFNINGLSFEVKFRFELQKNINS
ncbi:hypothetical protein [Catalinimonas niigatensis]|uniref:hypothetical protein n=1 Tax=Catalinimonas niigatensis TaxID=1397264 RepID=UPI0026663417|nr:hypothetical protein [Catalinimonas niigatensis]WPP49004.1 hypothetical protein PZB72_20260 [Catalinimonas niigatensis]